MNYVFFIIFSTVVAVFFVAKRLGIIKRKLNNKSLSSYEVLEVNVAKNDDETGDVQTSAISAENMFASLHGLLREEMALQEHISFEICSSAEEGIKFYVIVPSHILKFVESQIYAQYPTVLIKPVEDYALAKVNESEFAAHSLILNKEDLFPIKTFRDFEADPLSGITSSFSDVTEGERIWLQILVKPIPDVWQQSGFDYVDSVREGTSSDLVPSMLKTFAQTVAGEIWGITKGIITGMFVARAPADPAKLRPAPSAPVSLSPTQDLELKAIENKLSKMGFEVEIRLLVGCKSLERVESHVRSVMASLKQFSTTGLNSFSHKNEANKDAALEAFRQRKLEDGKTFVLNMEELASVYHLPSSSLETPNISWLYSKKSEPPPELPIKDCTFMGETLFRSKKVKFGMANDDDRLRHMYLIGKTGTGKSTLMETMITQDIRNGFGVGVLDPHGETIDKVLEKIPDNRLDDVIYFDPSDTENPVGLNLLEMDDYSQKNLMASGLVAAIKHNFEYSWGPRLEYLLNYCILTLLDVPGTNLLGITRLLSDDNYRKYILHQVKDPVTINFWEREYRDMKGNQKLVTEAIAPIQNKVNRFLASTTIRNILGQNKSTISMSNALNNGKILLMNLSKGKIGSDNSNLLGALLVSRIQFTALQRAYIPYEQRRPFYLYVDEFHNFATGSFEEILSESRKYKLGLYLTHQFTGQLPEEILKAVFGNVGTIATFSLGAPDAKLLTGEFAPYFNENDIISLDKFHIYIKLMVNGMTSLPFSARILLPWEEQQLMPKTGNKEKVLQMSREKYGSARADVEGEINKWVGTAFDKGLAIAYEMRSKGSNQPSKEVLPAVDATLPEGEEGYFDGFYMVTENGARFEVPANYAAKTKIVYGDRLKMIKEGEKTLFKQIGKVERKRIHGVLSDRAGEWYIVTDSRSYLVSKNAVEYNNGKVNNEVDALLPENNLKAPFAALEKFTQQ